MRLISTIALVVVSSVLVFTFQNCSKISTQSTSSPVTDLGTPGTDTPIVVVQKKCNNSVPMTKTITVDFPAPDKMCAWNVGGNSGTRDSYFQARTEQDVEFLLPAGATICDLDFQFQKQQFYYDDHILLALNDRILASSYNWKKLLSKDSNGLEIYDWSKIVNQDWETPSSLEGVFCAGMAEGLSTCQWPSTQVEGDIAMEFDKSIIQKVMAASVGADKHVFKFVTTGDNDTSVDCWHKAISFQVDVKYVP